MTTSPVVTITEELVAELEKLASKATPGRIHDRLDAAGGGIKYHCRGDDGSVVLQVDHKNGEFGFIGSRGHQDEAFFLACDPSVILALLAERSAMQSQIKDGIVTQDNLELYRKDALRYQWLRDTLRHDSRRWADAGEWNHSNIKSHEFDSAIDQAMQEQQP